MNGGHDLGGMHGLGPIDAEPENFEPVFHADWERRVFALTLACGFLGRWNIDISRHARERQHPADYIRNSYYENWLAGLQTLLAESGLIGEPSIGCEQDHEAIPQPDSSIAVPAEQIVPTLNRGSPASMTGGNTSRFQVGDNVRSLNINPTGHTRIPRYVRGKLGIVTHHHGLHIFADAHAAGEKRGEHLYGVLFSARELWGHTYPDTDGVHVDLWQPHLDRCR